MKYPINEDKTIGKGEIFFNVTKAPHQYSRQADGLKVDTEGNISMTSPGSIFVKSKEGKLLGWILTG